MGQETGLQVVQVETIANKSMMISSLKSNRIVSVGTLQPQKNPQLIIEAFAKISNTYPNLELHFYGDGELHEQLQNEIDSIGLADRILLKPNSGNILNHIRTALLFVSAADYDDNPIQLIRAMALGLPCIATDCLPGNISSIIEDGRNGALVPIGDADALADKISYMLDNPYIADKMGMEAAFQHKQ